MTTVHTGPAMPLEALADAVPLEPVPVPPSGRRGQPEPAAAADDVVAADEVRAAAEPVAAVSTGATSWLLRVGLAFVFAYAAAASLTDPEAAATYFPSQLPADLVVDVLVPAFALYEVGLAVALLSGRFTYAAAALAALTLAGIVVVNADAFSVLFRNVAIACAALALAADSRGNRRRPRHRASSEEREPEPEADATG